MPHPLSPEDLLCSNRFGNFFGVPQQVFDTVWNKLSDSHGESVVYVSMEIGADPDVFHPLKDFIKRRGISDDVEPHTADLIKKYLTGPRKIPNYSGGLGVLAGDTLKSFADTPCPGIGCQPVVP